MQLWIAGVFLLLCLAGIAGVSLHMRKREKKGLHIAGITVLAFFILVLCGYLFLTGIFIDTIKEQPAGEESTQNVVTPSADEEANLSETEQPVISRLPEDNDPPVSEVPTPTLPEDYDLPISEVPALHPDVTGIRALTYEEMPTFNTITELSGYALNHLINETFSFECYLSRDLAPDEGTGHSVLFTACKNAMAYYLFSAYSEYDMMTEDRGDEQGVYAKVKLIYINPDYDLEARAEALEFVRRNPVPEGGFADFKSEKSYARKIHEYIARKITYSPIGYDPKAMSGLACYDAKQEAYNVLVEEDNSAVCAGYARAFALIAQYAGIDAAWVWGNDTGTQSHAWNIVYPCDGSEPVIVDVTWDDTNSLDVPGQEEVSGNYFYLPLSEDYEHTPDTAMMDFLQFIHDEDSKGDTAINEEEAFALVQNIIQARGETAPVIILTGDDTIEGEHAFIFSAGDYSVDGQKFTAMYHYAVSDSGKIYYMDILQGADWILVQ